MRTGRVQLLLRPGIASLCLLTGACGGGGESSSPDAGDAATIATVAADLAFLGEAQSKPAPLLVSVQGVNINRESIVRSIGPKEPDEDEARYEERLRDRLLREALELVHAQATVYGTSAPILQHDPTPEEALRIFERHTPAFDEPHAIKYSVFMMQVVDFTAGDRRAVEEAVVEAHRRMQTLLSDYAHGDSASEVAARHGLRKQDWVLASEDWVEYPSSKIGQPPEGSMEAWAFSPERRPGETKVLEQTVGLVMGITVHAIRASRARTFEEAQDGIIDLIRRIRSAKRRLAHQLVLLGSVSIFPASVSDELEAKTREELQRINENPVWRDIQAN